MRVTEVYGTKSIWLKTARFIKRITRKGFMPINMARGCLKQELRR